MELADPARDLRAQDDLLVGGQGAGGVDATVGDRLLRAHELDGARLGLARRAGRWRRGTRSVAGAQAEGGGQAEPDGQPSAPEGARHGAIVHRRSAHQRCGRTAAAKSHVPSGRGESAKWTVRRCAPCAIASRERLGDLGGRAHEPARLHGPDVRRVREARELALVLGDQDAHAQDLPDPIVVAAGVLAVLLEHLLLVRVQRPGRGNRSSTSPRGAPPRGGGASRRGRRP